MVNVQTGEVVIVTTIEKTIVSTAFGSDVFKYFDTDTMLVEIEAGYARNEPVTFAIRKAIEKGVVELIHKGIIKDLWAFKIEEVAIPEKKVIDYTNDTEIGVHVDIGEKKKEKTYEDYLKQKEELKKLEQEENTDEKNNDVNSDSSSDTN